MFRFPGVTWTEIRSTCAESTENSPYRLQLMQQQKKESTATWSIFLRLWGPCWSQERDTGGLPQLTGQLTAVLKNIFIGDYTQMHSQQFITLHHFILMSFAVIPQQFPMTQSEQNRHVLKKVQLPITWQWPKNLQKHWSICLLTTTENTTATSSRVHSHSNLNLTWLLLNRIIMNNNLQTDLF